MEELRAQYKAQKARRNPAAGHLWRGNRKPRKFTATDVQKAAAARSARAQSRWAEVVALSDRGASAEAAAEAAGLALKQFRKYVRRHHGDWQWPLCN